MPRPAAGVMRMVVFLAAILLAPMLFIRVNNGEVVDTPMMLASTLGLALCLYALWHLAGRWSAFGAGVATIVLVLAAAIVRLLLAFLYDFSGRGFGSELFIHANVTSLLVAWDSYGDEIVGLLLAALLLGLAGTWLARRQPRMGVWRAAVILLPGMTLFAVGAASSPEWLLASSWYRYAHAGRDSSASGEAAREAALATLAPIRATSTLPVAKSRIDARAPARRLNLVFVYLESFNEMLTEHPRYPGLTPRINELKSRFSVYSPVYSSAYLTIEGIANSQCGTLMDMAHANNSLITREGRLPMMPCLGDILRVAGYRQVYLGGASLDFAGKGPFLREHGFDRTVGWEQWQARGFKAVAHWGISDRVLFEQALATIERLRGASRPFNLTLLTLGTHLPGFVYKGCSLYTGGNGDRFLNAVHCTDQLLGAFVDELERRGVLEDTVLFIQADHGVFVNPDMRELFGDAVDDKRLLTLVSIPDDAASVPAGAPLDDASVNTAATVLDLLGIEHNVAFLLGRSRFQPRVGPRYHLTRRRDYFRGEVVFNDAGACEEFAATKPPMLPLDDCEKRRALDAVRTLNKRYVRIDGDDDSNQVCQLAARVTVMPNTGRVSVKWGNEYHTRWFYHRGKRMADTDKRGVYALVLDAFDNVRHALFFGADNNYDLWRLAELAGDEARGGRLLLVSNTRASTVDEGYRHLWPDALGENRAVYGAVEAGAFKPMLTFDAGQPFFRFAPSSCNGGARKLSGG